MALALVTCGQVLVGLGAGGLSGSGGISDGCTFRTTKLIVAVGGNDFLVIGGEMLRLSTGDAGGFKILGLTLLCIILTPITSVKIVNSLKNWHDDSCLPDAPDLAAFFLLFKHFLKFSHYFVHASVINVSVKIKILRVEVRQYCQSM